MRGMILKDFKIGFKYILFMIITVVMIDLMISTNARIYGLYVRIILNISIYSYVSTAITLDMLGGSDKIIYSLPIRKKEIIAGKYLNIIVGTLLGLFGAVLLIGGTWIVKGINILEYIDLKNIFIMIGIIIAVLLFMIPAIYKYGEVKSKGVATIFMSLIIIVSVAFDIPVGFFNEIANINVFILLGGVTLAILSVVSYSIAVKTIKECEC